MKQKTSVTWENGRKVERRKTSRRRQFIPIRRKMLHYIFPLFFFLKLYYYVIPLPSLREKNLQWKFITRKVNFFLSRGMKAKKGIVREIKLLHWNTNNSMNERGLSEKKKELFMYAEAFPLHHSTRCESVLLSHKRLWNLFCTNDCKE